MPNFERDLKFRWISMTVPAMLIPVVLYAKPKDPMAFISILGCILGGFLIVVPKLLLLDFVLPICLCRS